MSLGISKVIITPMQRVVLHITEAQPAPDHYAVVLDRGDGHPVTDTFTGTKWRSPGLYAPTTYNVTLTAVYADPEDNQEVTGTFTVNHSGSMATILRQSVWDILFDAEIETPGRQLYSLHDGSFRPMVLRGAETPDMPLPGVEVGMPILRTTAFQSPVRKAEEWRVPLRILDYINRENPDDLSGVWRIAEQVQAAVDLTDSINLGRRGVIDKAWSWRVLEDPDPGRDRMSGLRLWLTVLVERGIGAVGV